ncbi:hypothetical protein NMG60_11004839 [Bertholletia excelsa]
MAATAMALQLRHKRIAFRHSGLIHFFSSSVSDSNGEYQTTGSSSPSQPRSESSFSFSDVKDRLKNVPSRQPQRPTPKRFSSSSPPEAPSSTEALQEIRKNLREYRARTAPPSSSKPLSLQELYKRHVMPEDDDSSNEASKSGRYPAKAITESLRQLVSTTGKTQFNNNNQISPSKIRESLNLRPAEPDARVPPLVVGGSDKLPASVFGREMKEEPETPGTRTEFLKTYGYGELGEKLRKLRPVAKGENWFSLGELNERLVKLREAEKEEANSRAGGASWQDMRNIIYSLKFSSDEKAKKQTIQRLSVLGQLGGTPSYMQAPPKEHLLEKYFHPDNMSSADKLKLELQKVRDEFKMSESDCGSARVQVAQLTTKIKHLSSVLHKKDKHSRKGLQAMVQRRKQLLKYLRRTDWDSYCLVLSKLGLRDNPKIRA